MSVIKRALALFASIQLITLSLVAQEVDMSEVKRAFSAEQFETVLNLQADADAAGITFTNSSGDRSDLFEQFLSKDGVRMVVPLSNGERAGLHVMGTPLKAEKNKFKITIIAYESDFGEFITSRSLTLTLTKENTIANEAELQLTERILMRELEMRIRPSLLSHVADFIFPKAHAQMAGISGTLSIAIGSVLIATGLINFLSSKGLFKRFILATPYLVAGVFALGHASMKLKGWSE